MEKVATSERLREIMDIRGLRQADLISKCQPICHKYNIKLTKQDLSQYLSGKVLPKQWKLTVLAEALGVSEAWLMGYDVPISRDPQEEETLSREQLLQKAFEDDPERRALFSLSKKANSEQVRLAYNFLKTIIGDEDGADHNKDR